MPTMPIVRQQTPVTPWARSNLNTLTRRIIPSLILAPSAHNTQPWKVRQLHNTLDLYVNWDRHLAISDPTQRQLYVSLGCAISNAIVAARHFGCEATVQLFPEGQQEHQPASRLTFTQQPARPSARQEGATDALFAAIEQRRTDRSIYDGQPLSAAERAAITGAHKEVLLVEDREQINVIAELTEQGTADTLSRRDFKEELSHWVRNNWTKQADGMPGYAMGIPAPLSLVSGFMVRFAPIHKQEAPKTKEQMRSASAVAIITTEHDTPADWVRAGQLLEVLWLNATTAHLAAAPLVAAVEAGESIRTALQQILATNLKPQSILRLGHSAHTYLKASPRRSVEDCLF